MATTIINNFISPRTPFEMVVKTDNLSTGSTANNQFRIPHYTSGTYNYRVDWGDGVVENVVGNTSPIHTYAVIGTYTVKVWGTFSGVDFGASFTGNSDRLKLLSVPSWDNRARWFSLTPGNQAWWFYNCSNLTSIASIPPGMIQSTNLRLAFGDTGIINFPFITLNNTTGLTGTFSSPIETFPLIDTSSVLATIQTWAKNKITNFPALDLRKSTNLYSAWSSSQMDVFGAVQFRDATGTINLSSPNTSYTGFWSSWLSSQLRVFPPNMFDNCANTNNYYNAFRGCRLTQESVNNILVSVNTAATNFNINNGWLTINDGTNATPSATGQVAADALRARSWTVELNGY